MNPLPIYELKKKSIEELLQLEDRFYDEWTKVKKVRKMKELEEAEVKV